MNKMKKIFFSLVILCITGIAIVGWLIYKQVYAPNLYLQHGQNEYLYIPTGSTFSIVISELQKKDRNFNQTSFQRVAERMNYINRVRPGRYKLSNGMNNKEMISLLRSGKQAPVQVTFNNIRNIGELCGVVNSKIEADSVSLCLLLDDTLFLKKNKLNRENCLAIFIPNTYEFYWNTSAEQFFERMLMEYKRFWNAERISKANDIGFSPIEVSVLASIVEKESNKPDERPVIAGVYINRLNKGWKLEADPTLVFALGDLTIRRVLNVHKEIDSPYNTYMHEGLPPGPICLPSKTSIDAVLNYSRHQYMFFCAKDDFSGYHAFARDYATHLLNAKRFQKELSRRNIRS